MLLKTNNLKIDEIKNYKFCLHKSWGLGKIISINLDTNTINIQFENNLNINTINFSLGKNILEFLKDDHILVKKINNPEYIQNLIDNNPIQLIIDILSFYEGKILSVKLEDYLLKLVGKDNFTKWWKKIKKLILIDSKISIPANKNNFYELKDSNLTYEEELLNKFIKKNKYHDKLFLLDNLFNYLKNNYNHSIENTKLKDTLIKFKENIYKDFNKFCINSNTLSKLYFALAIENINIYLNINDFYEINDIIKVLKKQNNLFYLFKFSVEQNNILIDKIKTIYPEEFYDIIISLLKFSPKKLINNYINIFITNKEFNILQYNINNWIDNNYITYELITWLLKYRNKEKFSFLFNKINKENLFSIIIYGKNFYFNEYESNKQKINLINVLFEDVSLFNWFLNDISETYINKISKNIISNKDIDTLTKKSILAKFCDKFPKIKELILNKENIVENKNIIFVTELSLNNKKEEYYNIINKKLPENQKSILLAKEHGDLRENSEYKMALEEKEVLLAKKSFLEKFISQARIIDFSKISTEKVNIGCTVTIEENTSKLNKEFIILGIWDTNINKNIISYESPIAKILINKTLGDVIQFPNDNQNWTIKIIDKYNYELLG